MTDEEYERIKAEEKAHLREMKDLREAARRLQRSEKARAAAERTDRAADKLDESSTLTRRLLRETARNEARADLALDAADDRAGAPADQAPRNDDPESRARALVRRLREEMSGSSGAAPAGEAPSESSPSEPPSEKGRLDKTIGPPREE